MKTFWLLFSIWTGGDGSDLYVFEKPTFETKIECEQYVKLNFIPLNIHVNNVHNGMGDIPNLFYCIHSDEFQDKFSRLYKGQDI
tara:strand:- start:211 stop:462 length:252 start_codon:yes stop_codon:yes gene_type:complete